MKLKVQFNHEGGDVSTNSSRTTNSRVSLVIILLFILFIAGFLLGEDGFGGKIRADLYIFHEPTILAFRNHPILEVLPRYNSATTPLFHILESFNPLLGNDTAFRASNMILGILTVSLFIFSLYWRFRSLPDAKASSLLIAGSVLLSPYFRAESYWSSTDILAIFFIVATALLLNLLDDNDLYTHSDSRFRIFSLLVALTSWSCFYCRQTSLFLPFYAFLLVLRRYSSQSRWILILFGSLGAPALYLIHIWNGLTPPDFRRHEGFSLEGIVQPFSMFFIYALPFLVEMGIRGKMFGSFPIRRRSAWLRLLVGLLAFIAIFHKFHFYEENRGGGIASKLLANFGEPGRYIFLLVSYLGFLVIFSLWREASWRGRALLLSFLFPSFFMTFFFQRYYDPVLFVLYFLFWERRAVVLFLTIRTGYILLSFNALLLLGALLYNGRTGPVFLPIATHPQPWNNITKY